jgi:hypothetical protein
MIANTKTPDQDSLMRQNRMFGAVYILTAVFTYFYVLYRR